MSNPHDVAAVLGGLLSDEDFRAAMKPPAQRTATLEAYGFIDVVSEDRVRIDNVVDSLPELGEAQIEVESECPNWPCPIIRRTHP